MKEDPKNLFPEFAPTSDREWQDLIRKELEKFADKIPATRTETAYYARSDFKAEYHLGPLHSNTESWKIRENIVVMDTASANKTALELLNQGIDSLGWHVKHDADLPSLLENIYIDAIEINWKVDGDPLSLADSFINLIGQRNLSASDIRGCLEYDPIGKLVETGNWSATEAADLETVVQLCKKTGEKLPHYKCIHVNADRYNAAGASTAEELGCLLAHANTYLNVCTDNGLDASKVASMIQLSLAAGTDYFREIAKFRATRLLWRQLTEAYEAETDACYIQAKSSAWDLTIYDPYVNLLRTTTAAMSAVLGGCDSLHVLPFDSAFRSSTPLSRRMARNIQHIIKEESYLDKTIDPAAGAYYIEILTDKIAREAWAVFQQIESKGGLIPALKDNSIQEMIGRSAAQKIKRINEGKRIVLGVNKHPNAEEKMMSLVEWKELPGSNGQSSAGKTSIEPLKILRGTAELEKTRLVSE